LPDDHHHHHGERRSLKHYVDDFFSNWNESEAPLGKKLWTTVKNRT
jgi:hypothetical protein